MVKFCKSLKCLVGKTAIVTGSNTGIGYETALDLAKRGCRVILACRNQEKAKEAKDKIVALTGSSNVLVKKLDLESLSSVREFVKDILDTEDRLDFLINNAGAAYLPEKITDDGLQAEMAVNYFGQVLLTMLLLDLLKKSAPSRIVNVTSGAAQFILSLNLEELNKYAGWLMYCRGKLCMVYFTQELGKRLEGTGVSVYSLDPGAVYTEFQRYSTMLNWIAAKTFKTAEEGAQTSLYLALEEGVEKYNGEHFVDCEKIKPYCGARDDKKRTKLWEVTERMVGLSQN